MKKILCILATMALCFQVNVKAGNVKIHAVVFCNTDDEKIGVSCQSDQERFAEELGLIDVAIGCEEDWHVFTGKDCNKPNLERAISGLNCGPNDVVFFYYSGHGVHAQADPADGWLPQMCLNYKSYDQDKFVPVTYVRDKLATKGARLSIILTDCCNNEASWVSVKSLVADQKESPSTNQIDVAKLKKLFCESRGTVIATSSKRGQSSYGPKEGGCFSVAFWDEMYRVEQGIGNADWKSVVEETKKRTLKYTSNKQEPVYEINISSASSTVNTTPQPTPQSPTIISAGDADLGEAFRKIVNPSYGRNERLNMVNGIVQRFFDSYAQVVMVGRDLTTNVSKPMPISEYLEELALSKRVKGVNIVRFKKNSAGKFSQIVISEIR